MTVTSTIERLGPKDAEALLAHNKQNRPLRESDVMKWAAEMEAGNWQLNGEAIKIDRDGVLRDGQHRLHALLLQADDFTTEFLIVRGIDPESQMTMDQGRKRSMADQLNISGVYVNNTEAAAIKVYLTFVEGMLFRDTKYIASKLSSSACIHWAQEHEEELELIRQGYLYRRIKARPAVVIAAYALIAKVHGVDVADEFFARTLDGVSLELGSPILALRNRLDALNGDLARQSRQRINDRDLLATIFVAFNAWVMGRSLGKIQRPTGAAWTADTFPRIVKPTHVKAVQTRRARGDFAS